MRVEMQVRGGKLIPPPGFRWAQGLRTVEVSVPDDALVAAAPSDEVVYEPADPFLREAWAMLGPHYVHEPSEKSDQELLEETLLEKYGKVR